MSEQQPSFEKEPLPTTGRECAKILTTFGEDYGFDAQTYQEIADLPFAEALSDAYGMLMQAGLDANELLAKYFNNEISSVSKKLIRPRKAGLTRDNRTAPVTMELVQNQLHE
jgi:hypothetical protein